MPAYNAALYIEEAINSILTQNYQNIELIVIDDESTDETKSIVSNFKDKRLLYQSKENGGASSARNLAFKMSSGEFIKFMDADDLLSSNAIHDQVKLAESNPGSVISSKWGRFYNNDISTFNLNPEECWKDMQPIEWICSSWRKGQSMTQAGMFLIPRKTLIHVGLWNEKLSLIDDFEFFTRIILASENVKFCQNAILYYRSGQKNSLSRLSNRKGAESELLAIQLATSNLLAEENTWRTKKVSSLAYANFIYGNYPKHNDLLQEAEAKLNNLPQIDFVNFLPPKFRFIARIFNWKLVKYLIFIKQGLIQKLQIINS